MHPDFGRQRLIAKARASAARERVGVIRKRVAVGTFSIFTAAWVGVFGQLVAGRDPALGDGTRASSGGTAVHRASRVVSPAKPAVTVRPRVTAPARVVAEPAPAVTATPLTTRQS